MVNVADGTWRMQWTWSDESFCERVAKRCAELGRSQRAVLKEAQCAHDYLQTTPTHGRRIDRIGRIAEVLELDVHDILGLPVMNGQIDRELALIAYQTTRDAMLRVQSVDDDNFVDTMIQIYNALLRRRTEGHDVRDPAYLKMIADFLQDRPTTARRPT